MHALQYCGHFWPAGTRWAALSAFHIWPHFFSRAYIACCAALGWPAGRRTAATCFAAGAGLAVATFAGAGFAAPPRHWDGRVRVDA